MHWKHYWQNIIVCYHVLIEGWPDNIPFKNLSEVLLSLSALESLLQKLKAGKIYWKTISDGEFKDMRAAHKAGVDDGTVVPSIPCHTCSCYKLTFHPFNFQSYLIWLSYLISDRSDVWHYIQYYKVQGYMGNTHPTHVQHMYHCRLRRSTADTCI